VLLLGFGLGHELYEARERLDNVESRISRVEKKLESEEISEDARKAFTSERIALEGERGAAQERLRRLEWEARRT
jgi:predicted  nucleic acid-binding Zn-ribbon protein